MPRQVMFDQYGGVEVLHLVDAPKPVPAQGQLLIAVRAAGLNPFDVKVRTGQMEGVFPVVLPASQGTDVAGVVEAIGPGVSGFASGDEIVGSTGKRCAQADFALVPQATALKRPAAVPWELGGSLWVVATTASAVVRAGAVGDGELVVVAGASGGVGGLVSQLARERGATVIGIAGEETHEWLRSIGVLPVTYGEGVEQRVRAAAEGRQVDVVLDAVGGGYVELGIALGVAPERIDTIADFAAAKTHGAKTDGGGAGTTDDVVTVLELLAAGKIEVPVHRTFALSEVQAAYTELEQGRPRGKIALIP